MSELKIEHSSRLSNETEQLENLLVRQDNQVKNAGTHELRMHYLATMVHTMLKIMALHSRLDYREHETLIEQLTQEIMKHVKNVEQTYYHGRGVVACEWLALILSASALGGSSLRLLRGILVGRNIFTPEGIISVTKMVSPISKMGNAVSQITNFYKEMKGGPRTDYQGQMDNAKHHRDSHIQDKQKHQGRTDEARQLAQGSNREAHDAAGAVLQ